MRRALWLALALAWAVPASATVFSVTNGNDAGPGSLRQAILDSNAAPGPNVIEISIASAPPRVIAPKSDFLPPIKGPAVLRVTGSSGANAPAVLLDGAALVRPRTPAACPGATAVYDTQTSTWTSSNENGAGPNVRGYYGAGLAIHDSHDVEISGLEIRNFCAGIVAVRSSHVYIHDVKIEDMLGAAGVIFTGDDGASGRTDKSFDNRLVNSVLLDNGDGFEFTRGTHDSLLQGTLIALTQPLPENGNAIEFASSGDNNAVIGNTFRKYVETAVTVNGDYHTIRDNNFAENAGAGLRATGAGLLIVGNTFSKNGGAALTVSGDGTRVLDNVVTGNAAQGIVIAGPHVTVSRNAIYDNGRLGIDVAPPPTTGAGGAGPAPAASSSNLPSEPVLDAGSKWTDDRITVMGSVAAKTGETCRVEIFISHSADRHPASEEGWGEGEKYLGTASATGDASGKGTFSITVVVGDPFGDGATTGLLTATTTDAAGSTSRFSRAVGLTRAGN